MKLLFDTHLLLWAAGMPDRQPQAARALLEDPENEIYFSVASIWEIATKCGRDRTDFRVDPRALRQGLLTAGYRELPIAGAHVLAVETLPPIHKDPFDRVLVAQASVDEIVLVTADSLVARYPGPVRLV